MVIRNSANLNRQGRKPKMKAQSIVKVRTVRFVESPFKMKARERQSLGCKDGGF